MKNQDFTAVKKLMLIALTASYMCIATGCAGSDNMGMNQNNAGNTATSSSDYVNSVTNGTDNRYNHNNGSLIEDAGDAADNALNHAGNAADDLFDDAGNLINDVTTPSGNGR